MSIFEEIGRFGAALRKARRNSRAIREMNALTPELQKMKLPDDKSFGQAVAVYGHRAGDVFNIGLLEIAALRLFGARAAQRVRPESDQNFPVSRNTSKAARMWSAAAFTGADASGEMNIARL